MRIWNFQHRVNLSSTETSPSLESRRRGRDLKTYVPLALSPICVCPSTSSALHSVPSCVSRTTRRPPKWRVHLGLLNERFYVLTQDLLVAQIIWLLVCFLTRTMSRQCFDLPFDPRDSVPTVFTLPRQSPVRDRYTWVRTHAQRNSESPGRHTTDLDPLPEDTETQSRYTWDLDPHPVDTETQDRHTWDLEPTPRGNIRHVVKTRSNKCRTPSQVPEVVKRTWTTHQPQHARHESQTER